MFTGLITHIARVIALEALSESFCLRIAVPLTCADPCLGESVSINGICLTLIKVEKDSWSFIVSPETQAITTMRHWQPNDEVNIERALKMSDRLGGHWVSGHIDGLGTLIHLIAEQDCYRLTFAVPNHLSKYLAKKGSIAIDGVSLTVNEINADTFSVMIIPHTWEHTIFHHYQLGQQVNLEVDIIARYIERLMAFHE